MKPSRVSSRKYLRLTNKLNYRNRQGNFSKYTNTYFFYDWLNYTCKCAKETRETEKGTYKLTKSKIFLYM